MEQRPACVLVGCAIHVPALLHASMRGAGQEVHCSSANTRAYTRREGKQPRLSAEPAGRVQRCWQEAPWLQPANPFCLPARAPYYSYAMACRAAARTSLQAARTPSASTAAWAAAPPPVPPRPSTSSPSPPTRRSAPSLSPSLRAGSSCAL